MYMEKMHFDMNFDLFYGRKLMGKNFILNPYLQSQDESKMCMIFFQCGV